MCNLENMYLNKLVSRIQNIFFIYLQKKYNEETRIINFDNY